MKDPLTNIWSSYQSNPVAMALAEESIDAQIKSATRSYQQSLEVLDTLTQTALKEQILLLHQDKIKLLSSMRDLKASLHQQKDDTTDIYYFLNKKCDESYEVIGKLEGQLITEQVDREQAEKMYEKRISEYEAIIEKHEQEMALITEKYHQVDQYHRKLSECEETIIKLRLELKHQEQVYLDESSRLERKLMTERESMRKDYDKRILDVKAETMASIEKKLEARSKDTLIENYVLKNNLHNQSIKTEEVLDLTNQIINKDKKLQIQLQLSKSTEEEYLVRMERYQRIIKGLNDKIANESEVWQDQQKQHESLIQEKDQIIEGLLKKIADLEEHQTMLESNQQLYDEAGAFLAYHLGRLRDRNSSSTKRGSSRSQGISSIAISDDGSTVSLSTS